MSHPLSNAKWISARAACQSPVFIRRFRAEAVTEAVLYITGLGYFEARINGQRVGDEILNPAFTVYDKRHIR